MKRLSVLLLLSFFLLSGGCSQLKQGLKGVQRPIDDKYFSKIQQKYETNAFRKAYDDEARKPSPNLDILKRERNKILSELILLTDVYYRRYEDFLYVGKGAADTGFDVAELGLTLWSTATGTKSLKTLLSAIASGFKGTRLSIDKNFFQRKAIIALMSTMRSLRKKQLAILLRSMQKPDTTYNLDQGLIDICEYYNAGTLVAALQFVFEQAGKEGKTAEKDINEIKKGKQVQLGDSADSVIGELGRAPDERFHLKDSSHRKLTDSESMAFFLENGSVQVFRTFKGQVIQYDTYARKEDYEAYKNQNAYVQ